MTPWLLLLFGVVTSLGTEVSLKTRPGTLFSIPLEFKNPKFSNEAPQWVKYESGAVKGVAGGTKGLFVFKVSENDGSEEVKVQIQVSSTDSSANDCFHQKYFGRLLNLQEKITFGIPGGHFKDTVKGTVFYYPSSCRDEITKKRSNRASGHHHKAVGDEIQEMGSGDDFDEEEEEDEEDYEGEDDIEHVEAPLQPTPTLSFYHPTTTANVENDHGNNHDHDDLLEDLSTPLPSSSTDYQLLHSYHSPPASDLFPQEYGSGDFDILPTTPIPVFGVSPSSATPEPEIIELTPTLPPDQPILKKLIEKLQLPAGKVFKFNIANGYFHAPHPIVYSLQPTEKDSILPNWVTLEDGIFIAWPAVADISDYTINLVAQDTVTNGFTTNEIYLSVRQSSKTRNYNHEFEIQVLKNISHAPQEPLYGVIEKVQEYAGGIQEGDLIVTKIERSSEIITIKWTNESLIVGENQHKCPEQELREIYLRLVDTSGSANPNVGLIRKLAPTYVPKSIGIHLLPQTLCASGRHSNITGIFPTNPTRNHPPKIQHPLDSLFTTSGELYIYKVPEMFCYDPDDGYAPFLNLNLLDRNGVKVDSANWLQFDENNQEFFGLPPPLSSGKPQIEEYTLKCMDKSGKSDNDALEVEISPGSKADYSAEFRLHFHLNPKNATPSFLPKDIRKFIERLGKAMNESIKDILVTQYQNSGDDVQFLWHLRSNPTTEAELTQLRRTMLQDDGSFTHVFKDQFKPEFALTFGQIIPKGRLLAGNTQTHDVDGGVDGEVITEGPILGEDGRTYLITYIIPAVLIALMVLLALLIACLLSKKRKSLPRSSEEARAFIKKGVPIIFQDELEEDKGARSRSPAILREEHPPLPPEYRRSPIQQYQPPPPMSRIGGSRGGVRPGTHYRKPPPYLPP